MNAKVENVAKFIAAAIMADGIYDEAEKIALGEIADALEYNADELTSAVETEINVLATTKNVKEYLCVASTEIDDKENNIIFEALLEIVLVDGKLSASEVGVLLESAELLAIPQAEAVLMLADMVKEESEIKIEF